jgi:hypothetical protein
VVKLKFCNVPDSDIIDTIWNFETIILGSLEYKIKNLKPIDTPRANFCFFWNISPLQKPLSLDQRIIKMLNCRSHQLSISTKYVCDIPKERGYIQPYFTPRLLYSYVLSILLKIHWAKYWNPLIFWSWLWISFSGINAQIEYAHRVFHEPNFTVRQTKKIRFPVEKFDARTVCIDASCDTTRIGYTMLITFLYTGSAYVKWSFLTTG